MSDKEIYPILSLGEDSNCTVLVWELPKNQCRPGQIRAS